MQVPLLGHSDDIAAAVVQRVEQKRTVRELAPLVMVFDRQSRVSLWQGSLGEHAWYGGSLAHAASAKAATVPIRRGLMGPEHPTGGGPAGRSTGPEAGR